MASLSGGFVERIRILKSVVDEVYPKSLDEWINGFEYDSRPEKELLIWECIALTYNTFIESRPLSLEAKKEAISVLLQCSMGVTEGNIKSQHKALRQAEVWLLYALYQASADATIAVDNGRSS